MSDRNLRSAGHVLQPFLSFSLLVAALLALMLLRHQGLLWAERDEDDSLPQAPLVSPVSLKPLLEKASVEQKKQQFFALLKPMVETENRYILAQRRWLQSLDPAAVLNDVQRAGLRQLVQQYVGPEEADGAGDDAALLAYLPELLLRVQTLPVEMVLVQAANESAWGRSRFAQQGNNLFGQWCFSRGCGLVPLERNQGSYHEVAAFDSPQLSIRAYLNNLNRFWAYEDLRQRRAALLQREPQPDSTALSLQLIEHLERYSQRGIHYVQELKTMVRANKTLIDAAPGVNLR